MTSQEDGVMRGGGECRQFLEGGENKGKLSPLKPPERIFSADILMLDLFPEL